MYTPYIYKSIRLIWFLVPEKRTSTIIDIVAVAWGYHNHMIWYGLGTGSGKKKRRWWKFSPTNPEKASVAFAASAFPSIFPLFLSIFTFLPIVLFSILTSLSFPFFWTLSCVLSYFFPCLFCLLLGNCPLFSFLIPKQHTLKKLHHVVRWRLPWFLSVSSSCYIEGGLLFCFALDWEEFRAQTRHLPCQCRYVVSRTAAAPLFLAPLLPFSTAMHDFSCLFIPGEKKRMIIDV